MEFNFGEVLETNYTYNFKTEDDESLGANLFSIKVRLYDDIYDQYPAYARPLNINNKTIPLVGEHVLLIYAPNQYSSNRESGGTSNNWYYISNINRENFMYDIIDIDGGSMQYTEYGEGEYYHWHNDDGISRCLTNKDALTSSNNIGDTKKLLDGEHVRKLSFSIQLSGPKDYVGGELQFLGDNGETFFAPKQKGSIIVFDSRTKHRVLKVKSGIRRSLVGWVVGPRWK